MVCLLGRTFFVFEWRVHIVDACKWTMRFDTKCASVVVSSLNFWNWPLTQWQHRCRRRTKRKTFLASSRFLISVLILATSHRHRRPHSNNQNEKNWTISFYVRCIGNAMNFYIFVDFENDCDRSVQHFIISRFTFFPGINQIRTDAMNDIFVHDENTFNARHRKMKGDRNADHFV